MPIVTLPFDTNDRYHRQMLLPDIGDAGQARLSSSHVFVAGCGALGCAIIDALARAGVGTLTIIDRDLVELTNLQRQALFVEADVEDALPKAEAARRRIAAINRAVTVHAHVDDLHADNARRYTSDADVLVDGLDNFETRYLLNDLAVRRGVPYVYGGAVGTVGTALTILPHPEHRADGASPRRIEWTADQATPCLRCIFPEAPPPGSTPTCDTAGVLGPVVTTIAAHQAVETIKLLVGAIDAVDRSLLSVDVWANESRRFDVHRARSAQEPSDCPCCGRGDFAFMEGDATGRASVLCGRDAVQITPPPRGPARGGDIDLAAMAARLEPHGVFIANAFLLRGVFERETTPAGEPIELTLFPNGRAIVKGIAEADAARALYARYVGT